MSTWFSRRTSLLFAGFLLMTGIATAAGSPELGKPAPAFKLQDQAGKWHSLSDYKGQWVALYFYPKDDTPGCTTQACSFRDNVFAFKKENAVILGISVDDVASHKAFAEKHGLPFTLVADEGGKVRDAFGVKASLFGLVDGRETYVIDTQGIVRHVFNSQVRPHEHVKQALEVLKGLLPRAA